MPLLRELRAAIRGERRRLLRHDFASELATVENSEVEAEQKGNRESARGVQQELSNHGNGWQPVEDQPTAGNRPLKVEERNPQSPELIVGGSASDQGRIRWNVCKRQMLDQTLPIVLSPRIRFDRRDPGSGVNDRAVRWSHARVLPSRSNSGESHETQQRDSLGWLRRGRRFLVVTRSDRLPFFDAEANPVRERHESLQSRHEFAEAVQIRAVARIEGAGFLLACCGHRFSRFALLPSYTCRVVTA